MRLLYTTSDGRLGTENFIYDKVPQYAILSHTWKDGQEVTFADLKELDSAHDTDIKHREGYRKIRFCAQQAKRDGLKYFWVDTCCIDKANYTELSKSINSMFRWYQNARKCYAFLSDVSNNTLEGDGELAFRQSRWFKRGWTLQELLAPRSVEFFSQHGARLGDKKSLKRIIHDITGIPIIALTGGDLSKFDVNERFSWAVDRQTSEEEDGAYCLFGIFGVHLPLIYGEGREKALKRLKKEVEDVSVDIAGTSANDIKARSQSQEEKLSEICAWLSAPDPSTNYQKAHRQRQAETGLWLLESQEFTDWKKNAASRLWLHGIPGCGKTILSSTVIEHLLQHCHGDLRMVTAYFYFDFNDTQKQDAEKMLCSLLCQLLQRSNLIPKGVYVLFSSCENGKRKPSLHALLEVTRQTAQIFTHVYFVLDALDECTQRPELMDLLETVAVWGFDNLHVLITSRKERDIEMSLRSYIGEEETICLQRDVVNQDIQRYIQQRLRDDKSLTRWNKDAVIRREIEATLMRGACGMFRWAACQLDTLAKCRNRKQLRESLATLPPTLDQTYDRILSAISAEDSVYAIRILRWLTFSFRPLSIREVAEVVAIDVARELAFDHDEVLVDPLEALDICSGLVTVTTNKSDAISEPTQPIVALSHYSVREYLVSDRIKEGSVKQYSMQEAKCHSMIATGSLKYLIQLKHPMSQEILEASALAMYTAKFWSNHLKKAGDKTGQANKLAIRLMTKEEPAYLSWLRLHEPTTLYKLDLGRTLDMVHPPLQYAVMLGLEEIVKLLLDKGADPNENDNLKYNALLIASSRGYERIVKALLDKGANINASSRFRENALQAAASKGHGEVVEILLDHGAEVNQQFTWMYSNALHAASANGHELVVKILLRRGAEVNAHCGRDANALLVASFKGHNRVVETLLDHGAEINTQVIRRHGNVLQTAAYQGKTALLKLLLSKVEITQLQDRYNRSLVWMAAAGGHADIVRTLVKDYNHDPQMTDKFGRTPYWIAFRKGHSAVLELLSQEYGLTNPGQAGLPDDIHDPGNLYCSVCTSRTNFLDPLWGCWFCFDIDWRTCGDCKRLGAYCEDETHIWMKITQERASSVVTTK